VKFLFLPPEHDPDSYIREHGQEAFARFVRQAVPLSTFLIEASAEGCDLATAEGRSHMISNAGPLWKLLPDGALKRQLLTEIAERAQLAVHDLMELWGVAPPAGGGKRKPWRAKDGDTPYAKRAYGAGHRQTVKPKSIALAELIARAALRNSESWGLFSHEDHHLLCELQPPVGDLFSWIDARFHEHGGEPWAVLQLGVEGQPFAELANRLINLDNLQPHGRAIEVQDVDDADLRRAMTGIHLDAVTEEMKQVSQLPPTDPGKMERLYELTRRQKALLEQQKPGPKP